VPHVLIVHREQGVQRRLARHIATEGHVATTGDGERALELLATHGFEVVIADPELARLVAELRERHEEVEVLVLGEDVRDDALDARRAVRIAIERQQLRAHVRRLSAHVEALRGAIDGARLEQLVAESLEMREVVALAARAAPSEAAVVIAGEPGTGKHAVAHAIHHASTRAARRVVRVDCAGIAEWLFEPTVFGHGSAAFAGRSQPRRGLLGEAHRGTLVLERIEALAPSAQAKLARALADRAYRPIGEPEAEPLDVRVIATTAGAPELVPDLRYQLEVLTIMIPPLRERRVDIGPLAALFVDRHRRAGQPEDLAPCALGALAEQPWPGNAADLERVVRHTLATARGTRITAASLGLGRQRA